jgi:hypothetical protein
VTEKKLVGRLAMRVEGTLWNAYYASNETMQGAIFLGSIRYMAVKENRERKEAFMQMMRDIVDDIFEEKFGHRSEWGGPTPAPENERGGVG